MKNMTRRVIRMATNMNKLYLLLMLPASAGVLALLTKIFTELILPLFQFTVGFGWSSLEFIAITYICLKGFFYIKRALGLFWAIVIAFVVLVLFNSMTIIIPTWLVVATLVLIAYKLFRFFY